MEDEMNLIELEVTDTEMAMLQMSLGMLIARIQNDIDEWENRDDRAIDLLSGMYDKQFAVMSVWRKVLVGAGVPSEIIAQVLASDDEGGE